MKKHAWLPSIGIGLAGLALLVLGGCALPLGGGTAAGSSVAAVAVSRTGQSLAVGYSAAGDGNTVRIWNLRVPGNAPQVLAGNPGGTTSVAFSPDGQTLATAGKSDQAVRLWPLSQAQPAPTVLAYPVKGSATEVHGVAFSPDGKTLAAVADDATARLWNMSHPEASPTIIPAGGQPLTAVAFSPDGQTLAAPSADGKIRLWDLSQIEAGALQLAGNADPAWGVGLALDGKSLAAGCGKNVCVWDILHPQVPAGVFHGHTAPVYAIAFSPINLAVASGSDDMTVRLWDVRQTIGNANPTPLIFSGAAAPIRALTFTPDGNTLIGGSLDGTIYMWNALQAQSTPTVLTAP